MFSSSRTFFILQAVFLHNLNHYLFLVFSPFSNASRPVYPISRSAPEREVLSDKPFLPPLQSVWCRYVCDPFLFITMCYLLKYVEVWISYRKLRLYSSSAALILDILTDQTCRTYCQWLQQIRKRASLDSFRWRWRLLRLFKNMFVVIINYSFWMTRMSNLVVILLQCITEQFLIHIFYIFIFIYDIQMTLFGIPRFRCVFWFWLFYRYVSYSLLL